MKRPDDGLSKHYWDTARTDICQFVPVVWEVKKKQKKNTHIQVTALHLYFSCIFSHSAVAVAPGMAVLKYHNKYWMNCNETFIHLWPEDEFWWLCLRDHQQVFNNQTEIGTDIHGPQRINWINFEASPWLTLIKVLSHPGHDYSKCCNVGNWTCFSFLEASSVLTKGVSLLSHVSSKLQSR